VREAVEAEPVEPLAVKGKTDELAPMLLLGVVAGAEPFARRLESQLVGRERELDLLRQAYRRSVDESSCHLFTVLGPAGIGKSRIAQEFLADLGQDATVVTGRCLSYGEGITYWPLVEILEQLGNEERLVQFLEGEPEARTIVNTVLNAIGQAEGGASPEETPWAVRKLLEALAREQPLVVVFDDLQWAEPTFLDLVEHVADLSRDAPILLLCISRGELLDDRPGWAGGKLNATSILLEPLSEAAAETLIENLLAGAELAPTLRRRVSNAAEGNPLFVEQMLAMISENGAPDTEISVPPTIQALLAARLDRLDDQERTVIERAAVIGKEFWLGALTVLVAEPAQVPAALQLLVRKELIRPHRSTVFPSADAFRFRHQLIRDGAYSGMAKELRAELHERFADWLEEERSEFDEIVGYHLEQGFRYRSELGPLDESGRELGRRAGERLGAAGIRAAARSDMPAAANLIKRALAVLPPDHPRRSELRLALGDALAQTDLTMGASVLGELIEDAAASGDARTEWRARVTRAWIQLLNHEADAQETADLADTAIAALTELGDDEGLARAWRARGQAYNVAGDYEGLAAAMQRAYEYAVLVGDSWLVTETGFFVGLSSFYGRIPVAEAQRRLQGMFDPPQSRLQHAHKLFWEGALSAIGGGLDEGLRQVMDARAVYAELGLRSFHGGSAIPHARIALLADEAALAETVAREAESELEALGERGYRSTVLALLAEALYAQARYEEAERVHEQSEALTSTDDLLNEVWLSTLGGKLAARRGDLTVAESLACEGLRLAEPGNNPWWVGDAAAGLAEVLGLVGRTDEAREAAERALEAYERKGSIPAIERTRSFLSELVAT